MMTFDARRYRGAVKTVLDVSRVFDVIKWSVSFVFTPLWIVAVFRKDDRFVRLRRTRLWQRPAACIYGMRWINAI